jgi:MoaA/NifB/PqqE/SkfB family radical SAM enzyme
MTFELIKAGLEYLIVSLDGNDQESYEKYRVGGDFQKVIDNISLIVKTRKKLRLKNPVIEWQYLIFRHNENQMEEAANISKRIGADVIRFAPFSFASEYTIEQVKEWVPLNSKNSYYDRNTGERREILNKSKVCAWLYRTANFNWDGSVSACCNFNITTEPSFDFGNINDKKFSEIWNNDDFQRARMVSSARLSGENSFDFNHFCSKCDMV